jgi:hypothetical protein
MAFIRIKKISGNPYAYLVQNKWTEKGSRQGKSEYLGRVAQYEDSKEVTYDHIHELGTYKKMCKELILLELRKKGFAKEGKWHVKDAIRVDLPKVLAKGNNSVIESGEGFICEYSYKKLLGFKAKEERFEVALAKTVLESGIAMPPESFVYIYEAVKRETKLD